jgi:hypothetical protein
MNDLRADDDFGLVVGLQHSCSVGGGWDSSLVTMVFTGISDVVVDMFVQCVSMGYEEWGVK